MADERVRVSADGGTAWVYGVQGDTVGRFSKRFGMDVHTTVQEQLGGAPECIACTHKPAVEADWVEFCRLMLEHYQTEVDRDAIKFPAAQQAESIKGEPQHWRVSHADH